MRLSCKVVSILLICVASAAASAQTKPVVQFIATGGTIAMKVDPVTKGVVPAISGDDLMQTVPDAVKYATIEVNNFSAMSANYVEAKWWTRLTKAVEAVAPDALVGDVVEEALDHVQPRCAGRGEVHDEARMPVQPLVHVGMAVCGVVVDDQMQAQMPGRAALDELQELELLAVAVARLAHRDHATVQGVERRKQRGRAMRL